MDTHAVFDNFEKIWRLEIFSTSGNSVILSQLVIAIFVIVFGAIISKLIAGAFRRRLVKFKHIRVSTSYTLQRLFFYLLLVIFTLISLSIAGIPITVFTVLGGALAIGVGFGAQNLFNNFISSFVIMFEQPIRVGDIIIIQGMEGKVEEIGNRRVRVRRTDGVDLLVPNSFFLEQIVVNWTLSDRIVRGSITAGIAYGSDTELAHDILMQCAIEHEKVNQMPQPVVFFENFGDNALVFSLHFWTMVSSPMDMRKLESDLRYSIDRMFREKGITISYPQRDIHFDTEIPVNIRVNEQK